MFGVIGLDTVIAAVTAVWFFVAGVSKLRLPTSEGRRAVAVTNWAKTIRRVRGVIEMVLALIVALSAGLAAARLSVPQIGLWLGLGLSGLGLWTAVESFRPPLRPVRIVLAVLGFALAVFFAGFR